MNVLLVYYVAFIIAMFETGHPVNGLKCYCTPGLKQLNAPPCVRIESNGSTANSLFDQSLQDCDNGRCVVGRIMGYDGVAQLCANNIATVMNCDNGLYDRGVCCKTDSCNSIDTYEIWERNLPNDSTTLSSPSSVGQSASSTTITKSRTTLVFTATPTVVNTTPAETVNVSTVESSSSNSSPPAFAIALIVVLSFIILVVAIIIVIILSMYFYSYYRNNKPPIKDAASSCSIDMVSSVDMTVSSGDWSAGSDSGLPVLVQAHIARQITRVHLIGRGRYGQVWRGYYKGEDIAVKVFQSIEETSWLHEVDIYNKCALRHPNILRFIAADRSDAGMFIENWLIVEYCENGNLYDYLQCYVLAEATVVAMAHDIASGLVFIHSEIMGTEGKASIAHRDLKSRNILVKKDLSLVIGDFGLAVRHDISEDTVEEEPTQRVGTKRYLAPEILDETMNMKIFDSFKRADIYSFGLVLWEIVRRGQCNGVVEEPQLPYYDCVPCDPSFEEMQQVVCVEQRRPLIPSRWYQSPVFSGLAKLMNECWHHNGEARLKALRVRRRLEDIHHKNFDKGDRPKSTAKLS